MPTSRTRGVVTCTPRGDSGFEVVAAGIPLESLARPTVETDDGDSCRGDPLHPPALVCVVGDGVVLRGPVVPNGDVALSPMPTDDVLWPRDIGLKDPDQVQ